MNTKNNIFRMSLFIFAALLITFSSCRKDEDETTDSTPTVDYKKEMTDYMKANSMDLNEVLTAWTISAHDLDSLKTSYYIIDLRSSTDFDAGHIEGAHNTTLANIVTEAANSNGKPIAVACYTGQTAAHGLVGLRLSGYSDCKILLFGMSSWNSVFDHWTDNVGNAAVGNDNWSSTNTISANAEFSEPTFTSSSTTGAAILADRVQDMLDAGFQGVTNTDVLANPENYFINNYWAESDINIYGHIKGAHRIKEDLTLALGGFKYYDKDATVVTYCWTSQTSSAITAYLNILGYNAKSLKFGANGMIHDALQVHKWSESGSYSYVTSK